MIPGPVEVDSLVLEVMARPVVGHTSPGFVETFGACLDGLRDIFAAPDGQPFVIAGSGTLAMEIAVASLVEPGDHAVVVETDYFSARMADVLRRHGAQVDMVHAQAGHVPERTAVEAALAHGAKLLTVTHVDTSTGVLAPVRELAALARKHGALIVVDGVCAVGGQEFRPASRTRNVPSTQNAGRQLLCRNGQRLPARKRVRSDDGSDQAGAVAETIEKVKEHRQNDDQKH